MLRKKVEDESKEKEWIPLCERESISPIWIFAICSCQIAINFVWAPLGVLTIPMCTKLGLSHKSISLVSMIGSVIGLIIPPLVSALSDSTTLKFGRRRIYLIIGEFFVIIGLLLLSFCREVSSYFNPLSFLIPLKNDETPSDSNFEAVFYFVVGQILACIGGNLAGVPSSAMISDVVPSSQKVLASSIGILDSAISASISNSIGAFKLYRYFNLSNETFVLLVSCIIGIIAMTVSVISTPEERLEKKEKSINPIKILINSISSIDMNFGYVILATFLFNFGNIQFYSQGANYVAKNIFGGIPNDPDGVYDAGISFYQLLMLILTISQFFFSLINTKLINKFGFKMSWILANLSQAAASILLLIIDSKNLLFIPYLLAGFTGCVAGSVPYAYVSLHADPEKIGEYFTLLVLTCNVSAILSNFVMQMYIGSFEFFKINPGRIIALGPIFYILSILCVKKGFLEKKKIE